MDASELVAADRCDRCGAQAYHVASKTEFGELLFCNHHHREFKDALFGRGWLISSNTADLEPVPAPV